VATTRLILLHANKGKTIAQTITDSTDYIENPDKTRNGELVTGYACDPRTADAEFHLAKQEYYHITGRSKPTFGKDVLAYHIRQAFPHGEVTAEEANRIGHELAMRFTKGNHAFIVATHIDKSHYHSHIIFNSTTLDSTRKFRNFWGSTMAIRHIGDTICIENGLSVIENPKPSKGKNYHKWLGENRVPSFQEKLRNAIDDALAKQPSDFEEFLRLMKESGYKIGKGKHITFLAPGQKRPTRCDTLKGDYTEAKIRERIAEKRFVNPKSQSIFSNSSEPQKLSLLIDVQNSIKAKSSPGYERWAKIFNLKQAAKTLILLQENNLTEYPMLQEKAKQAVTKHINISGGIKAIEERMKEISELQKQIGNYGKTKDVYTAYRNAGYSKKYRAEHESEILIHQAAKKSFDDSGLKKIPSVKALKQEYATLLADKKKLYSEYHAAKKEMKDLLIAKSNVDRLLGYRDAEQETKKKNPEH